MAILTLNCGSSSVKYQLFVGEALEVAARGRVERIGEEGCSFTHRATGAPPFGGPG